MHSVLQEFQSVSASLTPHELEQLRFPGADEVLGVYRLPGGQACLVTKDPATRIVTVATAHKETCITPAEWLGFKEERQPERLSVAEGAEAAISDLLTSGVRRSIVCRRLLQHGYVSFDE